MNIKYLRENEPFGESIDNEIIEVKFSGFCVWIESIVKEESGEQAIDRFFACLQEHRSDYTLKLESIEEYALSLYFKGKNSRKNTFNQFGYSWMMEEISFHSYYIMMKIDVYRAKKYTISLEEMIINLEN